MDVKNHKVNSEYMNLKSVILYKPGPEIENIQNPKEFMLINKIKYNLLCIEYENIKKTFQKLNISIVEINQTKNGESSKNKLFNMMYCRDLLFMTPNGAIISNMAFPCRKFEVKYIIQTLRDYNVPIRLIISDPGTFEGADALWLKKDLVIIGIGRRTNLAAFNKIKEELIKDNIFCINLPMKQNKTQHLLGTLQIIDSNKALVRKNLLEQETISCLKENGFILFEVPENEEVLSRQAMNIVTISPNKIIMPTNCPHTKNLYLSWGIEIIAEIPISQLINGAGGLACATGILSREIN